MKNRIVMSAIATAMMASSVYANGVMSTTQIAPTVANIVDGKCWVVEEKDNFGNVVGNNTICEPNVGVDKKFIMSDEAAAETKEDVYVNRLFTDLAYTAGLIDVNGDTQRDPSFNLWMNGVGLTVENADANPYAPTWCYVDPIENQLIDLYTIMDTNGEHIWVSLFELNEVAIYDHTSVDGKLIFKTTNDNNSVSTGNTYWLRSGSNCAIIDAPHNPYGDPGLWGNNALFYASTTPGCPAGDIQMEVFDSSNTDRDAVDAVATTEVFGETVKEFHTRLVAKTFGEIKLMNWIDVRNSQAPLSDDEGDYVSNNAFDDDIHEHMTDPQQPVPYAATDAVYYLLPHSNVGETGILYDVGTYEYFMDSMDIDQQADPIALYVQVTPGAVFDYSIQSFYGNNYFLDTNFDNWEPDTPNHGVAVIGWTTRNGGLEVVGNSIQHNTNTTNYWSNGVDFWETGLDPIDGHNGFYVGNAWIGGLQFQTATINWMNADSRYTIHNQFRTDSAGHQLWPDTTANCEDDNTNGNSGYWQWGGAHKFVPGLVEKAGVKQSNVKIYNGLVQDDTDRLHRNQAGELGYNDESNIARSASVYMRLIDDNGYIATADMGMIAANSAQGFGSEQMAAAGVAANPAFCGGDADNCKFAAEVFVDNDPNAVHIYATQTFDDMTNARVLPVYDDAEEPTAMFTGFTYNVPPVNP